MANKVIRHYFESSVASDQSLFPNSVDKSKSISELDDHELYLMYERLSRERDVEDTIKVLRRNSGERWTYETQPKIDTQTPINQLYHFGILGQKWGVRRYQNPDGSLTAAGKERYDSGKKSEDYIQSRADRANAVAGLSNAELKRLNERLQLEKAYKDLTAAEKKYNETFAKRIIAKIGEQSLTAAGTQLATGLLSALVVNKILDSVNKKKG